MTSIDNLASLFSKFPGIGGRQAKRFVYFLLTRDKDFLEDLVKEISELKSHVKTCPECMRYYNGGGALCAICANPNRKKDPLVIVEKDVDADNIEKGGVFDGSYFILGGSVPILEKEPEKKVHIIALSKLIKKLSKDLKEVIIATNLTPEGENTAEYIKNYLEDLQKKIGFKFSFLGRGLSTGTEIEYSDKDTLKEAFKNRH
ncbi:MAG: toprim domain-containing protein [Patescibacteria group bacterium]